MKTLTAKLAVAALLVAGSVKASEQRDIPVQGGNGRVTVVNPASVCLSTMLFAYNANDAIQTGIANWNSTQASKKKTRLQTGVSAVTNYALPAAQFVTAAALTAVANGYNCNNCERTPLFVKRHFTANAAMAGLTLLSAGKYFYNNRTTAQVTADAAVVAQLQAAVAAAQQAASAQTAAATSSN